MHRPEAIPEQDSALSPSGKSGSGMGRDGSGRAARHSLHLLYHELSDAPQAYSYTMPCERFEAHCRLVQSRETMQDASLLQARFTFDDGHRSDYEMAWPLLEKYGHRAHFFITAGWTGQRAGYMNWPELRALAEGGNLVGAHGWSHALLTHCSKGKLDRELRGARARLEDGLGRRVTAMSLPGGRVNARVLAACYAAGYAQVYTSAPKPVADVSASVVGRLNLQSGAEVAWLERVLDPSTGALDRLYRMHRFKAMAKSLLGDALYARLWAIITRQSTESARAEAPMT